MINVNDTHHFILCTPNDADIVGFATFKELFDYVRLIDDLSLYSAYYRNDGASECVPIKCEFFDTLKYCIFFGTARVSYDFDVRPNNPFSFDWDFTEDGELNHKKIVVSPVFYDPSINQYFVVMPEHEDAMPWGDIDYEAIVGSDHLTMNNVKTEFLGGHYVKNYEEY